MAKAKSYKLQGREWTVKALAEELGLSTPRVHGLLKEHNEDIKAIFALRGITPKAEDKGQRARLFDYKGNQWTVKQLAEEFGLSNVRVNRLIKEHDGDIEKIALTRSKSKKAVERDTEVSDARYKGITNSDYFVTFQKDVEIDKKNLGLLLKSLLNYGIIHEDSLNDIVDILREIYKKEIMNVLKKENDFGTEDDFDSVYFETMFYFLKKDKLRKHYLLSLIICISLFFKKTGYMTTEEIIEYIETKRQDFIPNLREETFWELEEEYI